MSAATAAIQRLSREKKKIDATRVREFYAAPLPENIFEWHFTLQGPSDSPYADGVYHGALRFPNNYPFAPPDIVFFTTSGRFEVGTSICSSISSYHPELWQPAYDIALVLVALRVFMAQDEEKGIGSLTRRYITEEEKRLMARESHSFECKTCGMKSAGEVWRTQMQGHPSVAPEVEANVPKVPEQSVKVAVVDATSAVLATAPAEQQQQGSEDVLAVSASRAVNAMTVSDVASNHEAKPAVDASVSEDNVSAGSTTTTTATTAAAETVPTEAVKSDAVSSPGMIRIRFGDRFVLRVSCRGIDRAITLCFSVCCAVLLKKCIWP